MKEKMVIFSAVVVVSAMLIGCAGPAPGGAAPGTAAPAGAPDEAAPPPVQQVVNFSIASAFDGGTTMLQAAQAFVDTLYERSDGTLVGTLFPAGVMGGERDNVEAMQIGELEMGVFGTFPIVHLTPEYSFFDAPFVFRDGDHYLRVWEGEIGEAVRGIFSDDHGIRVLGLMGRGYRHITANTPVTSPDDLVGLRMRMGQSPPFIDSFTEIGSVVIPIALPELYTSLQMGVVDGAEGPFDQIYTVGLHEVQDYLTISGHLFATSMWLMTERFYNSLSDEHRRLIDEVAAESLALGTQLSEEANDRLLARLQEEGMQVLSIDYIELRRRAMPAIERLFSIDWTVTNQDIIDQY